MPVYGLSQGGGNKSTQLGVMSSSGSSEHDHRVLSHFSGACCSRKRCFPMSIVGVSLEE